MLTIFSSITYYIGYSYGHTSNFTKDQNSDTERVVDIFLVGATQKIVCESEVKPLTLAHSRDVHLNDETFHIQYNGRVQTL